MFINQFFSRLTSGLYAAIGTLLACFYKEKTLPPLNIKYQQVPLNRKSNIPKVLYQTHESEYLPWSLYSPSLQTIYMNPNYVYNFYNAAERRQALVELFGENSRQTAAYDKLRDGAFKADIFRICILYAKGGVYMDCKSSTIVPLDVFIPHDSDFAMFIETAGIPSNSFIASSALNCVIKKIMDEGITRVLSENYGSNCLDVAGPSMFKTVLCQILGEKTLSPSKRYEYNNLKIDLLGHSTLFDSYMHDGMRPLIKRQPDNYMLNFKQFLDRYEWSWLFGRTFL
jgi:hypothetical protein